jgi:hypothetical protein
MEFAAMLLLSSMAGTARNLFETGAQLQKMTKLRERLVLLARAYFLAELSFDVVATQPTDSGRRPSANRGKKSSMDG